MADLDKNKILEYVRKRKRTSIHELYDEGIIPRETNSRYAWGFLEAMQQYGEIKLIPDVRLETAIVSE